MIPIPANDTAARPQPRPRITRTHILRVLCSDVGVALRELTEASLQFDAASEQVDVDRTFAEWTAADKKHRAALQAVYEVARVIASGDLMAQMRMTEEFLKTRGMP